MIATGFNGKISQIAEEASNKHRTSITRFISNSNWDESLLQRSFKNFVVNTIWDKSKETGKPIYFIVDDTVSKKN